MTPYESGARLFCVVPVQTLSESNQREHWAQRARRAKNHRWTTYLYLRTAWGHHQRAHAGPLVITLTRVAPHALDAGNLEASLKAVQDGVADWLGGTYGKGQDRQPGLAWHYRQRRGAVRTYAVEVEVDLDTEGPTAAEKKR